jgi:hypothetical protein
VKFFLEVAMDNAAFENSTELPRILREVATRLEDSTDASGSVFDINGNKVGAFKMRTEGA